MKKIEYIIEGRADRIYPYALKYSDTDKIIISNIINELDLPFYVSEMGWLMTDNEKDKVHDALSKYNRNIEFNNKFDELLK